MKHPVTYYKCNKNTGENISIYNIKEKEALLNGFRN